MQPNVINPYTRLGSQHTGSLDYIIANLPQNPTFDDLNNKLSDSFFLPDPNDPSITDVAGEVIKTMLPHAYNGYVNGEKTTVVSQQTTVGKNANGYWRYDEKQMALIARMLHGITAVPVESISDYLGGIEEEIVADVLTYEQQVPLLVAIAIGKRDHFYWMEQIDASNSPWIGYFNAESSALTYARVAGWVAAAMQGALLTHGLIKPPQIQLLDIQTSVIASTGLVAGKVIFGWIGR